MTRRILVMLLAFTALVLVGAVVPLTLNATSHDRSSFIQAAAGTARTDAVVAQARLDQLSVSGKNSALATAQAGFGVLQMTKEARQAGDGLLVLTNQGQRVAGSGMPAGNWDEFAMQANDEAQLPLGTGQPVQPITEVIGSEVIAAMPDLQPGQDEGTVDRHGPAGPLH